MVTVKHEKAGITTKILEVHLDAYKAKGWTVVKAASEQLSEFEEIAEQTISKNSSKAASERGRNKTPPKEEARAIIATELKNEKEEKFTDGLIKED